MKAEKIETYSEPRRHYLNASYGVRSWLFSTDHKRIALLYLVTITLMFVIGGAAAVLFRLELMTHIPELRSQPIELDFELNGERLCSLSLFEYDWLEVVLDVPETLRSSSRFELDIHASRSWQPALHDPNSNDDRHLSIAVCDLEII